MTASPHATASKAVSLPLLLGVLGVVYGDIGTSPLYALRAALLHFSADGIERWEILGILSLIIWSLILTVTVKYVTFILRADNKGEGGILALMALAQRVAGSDRLAPHRHAARHHRRLPVLRRRRHHPGDLGALGDGGAQGRLPAFDPLIIPGSVVILIALFLVQYRGTHSIGRIFGPVMALWFGCARPARADRDDPRAGGAERHLAAPRHHLLRALQAGRLHRLRLRGAVR